MAGYAPAYQPVRRDAIAADLRREESRRDDRAMPVNRNIIGDCSDDHTFTK